MSAFFLCCMWFFAVATVFNVHLGSKRSLDWQSVTATAVSAFSFVVCLIVWMTS